MNTLALDNDIEIAGERYEAPPRPKTETGDFIYRVPSGNEEGLRARVEKLNRRAARLGMEPLVLSIVGEELETSKRSVRDDFMDEGESGYRTFETTIRIVLMTLTGRCPRVNGWAMAATIQHEDGGNILRTVPGFEAVLPYKYRVLSPGCEHCNQFRMRKDTYVLQSKTDGWKQVGRNCLADFLRTTDASGLAEWAEVLASLDEEMGGFEDEGFEGGGHSERYFSALALLTQVACCVRADGWVSRGKAKDTFGAVATVDEALSLMDQKVWDKLTAAKKEKYQPSAADFDSAAAAIVWAQALPADVGNDYLWNIRVVSVREHVGRREAGLAGSIIAAYQRHLEREMERAHTESQPSEYFGTEGERGYFHLTVMGLREIDGQFGLTTLVMFRDAAGNRAKWFASGQAGLEIGATAWVKATIKGHEEYKGVKATGLSRVTVVDEDEVAAAAAKAERKAVRAAKAAAKQVAA